ncbi:TetR/AcrR family transcriptional regulator [Rhodococcus sp. IEGM 1408]|uniref:TetR/AcrR family transcriptional regulator n=1 Tax=Rhodococcus sp. IEGM 1408 TaxID=3082220 RepID=UPI0029540730|nr:WHG domain-containing protein [Rhodococcus sp. IEGM 1408]MDV8002445.1 TetR/AcrR family transcriptional regulator [Rhodococcus sp. IEGM 1408]
MVELSVPTAAGTVKKKAYHHGDLRNAIILEATARARTHGEKAIVLREIAPVIGVSATAAYRHFANRQQLVEEVSAQGFVAMSEQISVPRVTGADDAPVLAAYVDLRNAGVALVQFAAAEPAWARMMMETTGSSLNVAEHAWAACQPFQDIIDYGVEAGTFRAGTRIREQRVLWAGLDGLCANAMFGLFPAEAPEADRVTARTIDLCMTDLLTEEGLRVRDEASLPNGIITDLPR